MLATHREATTMTYPKGTISGAASQSDVDAAWPREVVHFLNIVTDVLVRLAHNRQSGQMDKEER